MGAREPQSTATLIQSALRPKEAPDELRSPLGPSQAVSSLLGTSELGLSHQPPTGHLLFHLFLCTSPKLWLQHHLPSTPRLWQGDSEPGAVLGLGEHKVPGRSLVHLSLFLLCFWDIVSGQVSSKRANAGVVRWLSEWRPHVWGREHVESGARGPRFKPTSCPLMWAWAGDGRGLRFLLGEMGRIAHACPPHGGYGFGWKNLGPDKAVSSCCPSGAGPCGFMQNALRAMLPCPPVSPLPPGAAGAPVWMGRQRACPTWSFSGT